MKITFDRLPESAEEFRALPQLDLSVPENTCALFLCALNLYVKDRQAGLDALNILRGPRPMLPYDAQVIRDRLMDKQYLPLAYFEGATPANGYTPNVPYVLEVLPDPSPCAGEDGYTSRYLRTTGADSPRPMKLRCKDGKWYLWEYSSIYLSIRRPAAEDPWA